MGSHKASDSFSSMNSESLQLCTEGLGFESSDEVEDLKTELASDWQCQEERRSVRKKTLVRSTRSTRTFPPPISSIGKSGKPWVCFKSYRDNDRFVLEEIRMPTQEFLHASREDGRLTLRFCQSDDEILEDEDEEDEENEGDDQDQDQDHDCEAKNAEEEENSAQKNVELK
ncbi:protein FAF-like, chloroplastic [Actinidia eriantha]|uniref:protein FAF-like, chloroplastic n=1 Tax=Actinidia eriantha TaxID=165200 RepID=UPI002586652F|nr:protein FAF-like, chloroplastic [Actinidia eriantha]